MYYPLFLEGYDPTSDAAAITRANLLKMIHEGQLQPNLGMRVWSKTAPDVSTYPILAFFEWAELDVSGNRTNNRYYHDGISWVAQKPNVGSLSGDLFQDGSINISKLDPTGAALDLIRINAANTAFEFIPNTSIFSNWTTAANKIFSDTVTIPSVASDDLVLLYDTSGTVSSKGTVGDVFKAGISTAVAANAFVGYTTDRIPFYNGSASVYMTPNYFFEQGIMQSSELLMTEDVDAIPIIDASAAVGSKLKYVALNNLFPDQIAAGTYSYPSSVTINAKGQVTAITGSGSVGIAASFVATGIILPTAIGGLSAKQSHGFAAIPKGYTAVLECTTADCGFAVGDTIPLHAVVWQPGGGSTLTLVAWTPVADATDLYIICQGDLTKIFYTMHKSTSAITAFTAANWRAKFTAFK